MIQKATARELLAVTVLALGSLVSLHLGGSIWLATLCATVLVAIAIFRANLADITPQQIFVLLVLATALPLVVTLVTGWPIVALRGDAVRSAFHNSEWVAMALAVMAAQCVALIVAGVFKRRALPGVRTLSEARKINWPAAQVWAAGSLMILSTVLANQSGNILLGNYEDEGFHAATGWFNGWPIIYCVASAWFFLVRPKQAWLFCLVWYGVIAFWLFHGNRSEILMQAVLPLALLATRYADGRYKIDFRGLPVTVLALVLILGLFEAVGYVRSHATMADTAAPATLGEIAERSINVAQNSTERGVTISTIGPSAYTLVATIGLVETGEMQTLYGAGYLQYIYRTFPSRLGLFPDRQEDLSEVLMERAHTLGGAHFGTEAYLNLGIVGAILFAYLMAKYLGALAHRSNNLFFAVWLLSLVFYGPRIVWYGNIYLYKLSLLFVGLLAIGLAWKFAGAWMLRRRASPAE